MKLIIPLIFLGCFLFLPAQKSNDSVVAKQGDGIFSILRKEGLDPVKYYPDFIELNADSLRNGSELVLGRTYLIPDATDSFKEMGIKINVDDDSESSIFGEELATFSSKSDKLKNAVIYLMPASSQTHASNEKLSTEQDILKAVAKELLLNGSKVYLLESSNPVNTAIEEEDDEEEQQVEVEAPMAGLETMRSYLDYLNKYFLKNSGTQKYQRLLVIDLKEESVDNKYHKVSVFHDNNTEGKQFANNIGEIFNKSKILDTSKDFTAIFAQKNNLFLAKNALPPLTFIEFRGTENPKTEGRIKVKPEKSWLTDVITSGIVNDYAKLEFQD